MIDLKLIVLLDAIHRRGTLASAAEELGKVPSAVSYIIQKYEDSLGFSLLRKDGRRVRFTEAGRHLYERGLPLLQSSVELADEARTIARGVEPRLRIAVEAWLTLDAITPALTELLHRFPELELQVFEEALSGTWEALLEGRVDIAIGAPGPKPGVPGIQAEAMVQRPGVCVASPDHPLTRESAPVSEARLAEERWIILRDTARAWVPREILNFQPRRRLSVGTMSEKIAAQKAGLGIGYLPRHLVDSAFMEGTLVEINAESSRSDPELLTAWRSDSRGRGLKALIDLVLRQAPGKS